MANVPPVQTPGITQQPLYFNNLFGIESRVNKRLSHPFRELPTGPPHLQPIVKMEFENNAAMRWQHPTDDSQFAFQQFRFDGDERFNLRGWLRNSFVASDYPLTYHLLCQDSNKRR